MVLEHVGRVAQQALAEERRLAGKAATHAPPECDKPEKVINSIHRKMFNGLTAYEYDTAYAAAA